MLWFNKNSGAHMLRRYNERQAITALINRDLPLTKTLPALIRLTENAFAAAEKDPQAFRQFFNEPMPEHLQIAAHLETDLWVALRITLDAARNAKLPAAEYDQLLPQFRQKITTLKKILDLEMEIMQSPLRKTFNERLQLLREART
jgi:hypothetical protein